MSPIQTFEAIMGPSASKEMLERIAADAEKSPHHQGVYHSRLLGQIFHGFFVPSANNLVLRNEALIQFARLHGFIDRGIPIVEDRIQGAVLDPREIVRERLGGFIAFPWPEPLAPHMEVLLRDYHRHGYLDLADLAIPYKSGCVPASYLEAAVVGSNPLGVTALLEMGASCDCVPLKEFAIDRGGERISVAPGDFDSFVGLTYGSASHPMRIAIDEGVRRRLAIDMSDTISQINSPSGISPPPLCPPNRHRARL